jgi:large subunit ribosomal protein L25
MTQTAQLTAESRAANRKSAAQALRRAGRIPAILYGHGREPAALSVSGFDFGRLLEHIAPESTIVELTLDGQTVKTLIREVQRHPLLPGILHVDFQEVHAGEKVRLEIAVHLVGIPDGVRNQGGVLDQVLRTIEIEVDPTQIPERVELDVSALVIGKSLHVSDLKVTDAKVLTDASLTVATVVPPRIEEAPVVAAAEGVVAEGAAPVEGAPVEPAEPELIRKRKPEEETAEE